jgi:hypothetical protein
MKMRSDRSSTRFFLLANVVALGTIAVGILSLILEPLGLISASKFPTVILLLLTLLATSELAERIRLSARMDSLLEDVAQPSTRIVYLSKAEEWYSYLANAMQNAQESIDDVVVSPRAITPESPAKKHYYKVRESVMNSPRITYCHATAILDQGRLDYILNVIPKALKVRYWVSIIDNVELSGFPSVNFMIIDKREVIFGVFQSPFSSGGKDEMLASKEPHLVNFFSDYFTLIWSRASPIISRKGVNWELIRNRRTKK